MLPLLNGLDHIAVLRERFAADSVLAGTIRVEADRPEPGVVVHTSPFLLVDMACRHPAAREPGWQELAQHAQDAGRPGARAPAGLRGSEARDVVEARAAERARVHDQRLRQAAGRDPLHAGSCAPSWSGAIEEGCAVGRAEGAQDVDPATAIAELERAHDTLGSSMQRDIAAGRPPELDAIPGSVLRAARAPWPAVPDDRAARGDDRRPRDPTVGGPSLSRPQLLLFEGRASRARTAGHDCVADRLDGLLLGLDLALVVLAVAEHPEVAGDAAVGVDRDAGRISSPSSKPRRSMSKWARPMPWAVCVGFSRSCEATACAKRSRFLAILPVSAIAPLEGSASVVHWERWSAPSQSMLCRPAPPPAPTRALDGDRREVIRTVELTKVYAGTDFAAVDTLDLSVHAGEIFGLLGPNGAGKTTTAGMLTTRVIPTSGSAYVGAIDVVAHPALAKQLIGIVSQQNTLDRQLTVWENLYFHGRLFGISASRVAPHRRRAAREAPPLEMGEGVGLRALRRDGPAADDGARDLPPPGRAVPRRADRGPRPAEPPRAVGDPRRAQPRGSDDPARPPTTWRRPTSSATAWRSWTTAGSSRSTRRRRSSSRVGADTIVTVKAGGDTDGARPGGWRGEIPEVTRTRVIDGGVELHVKGAERLVPRVVDAAEGAGFDLADLSVSEPSLETVFINLTGKELRD